MALPEKRRYTPAWLMLSVGTLLSIVAFFSVAKWERQIQRTELQNQTDKLATALQQSIDTNLRMLRATGSLYAASEKVERQEFAIFVHDFLVNYPSILAFSWSSRVTAAEREAYEQAIRAEGYANFEITERGAQGELIRAGERPEYFPVTYVESLSSQGGALGYDLISDPLRRIPLEKARDTGEIIATKRIKFFTTKKLGFLAFQPIYRKNADLNSQESRRQNFLGVTTAVFQVSDIVNAALVGLQLNNVDFYLLDNLSSGEERFLSLYQSRTKNLITDPNYKLADQIKVGFLCRQESFCTRTLNVADRQWSVLVVTPSGFLGITAIWRAWITLLIGLLLTTLLTVYSIISLRHTLQVEKLVFERTVQAKKLSETLEDSQQNADQLKQTLKELQNTQTQLIQTEKMSSLGQLVAGVAHEINNPVNFIYGNLAHTDGYIQELLELIRLYQRYYPHPTSEIQDYYEISEIDFLIEDLPKTLSSMKIGAERIRQIVLSLRNFSRFDEADMKSVDIHEGIDNTLLILQNRLKAKPDHPAIEVFKEYGKLPKVECYAGQLNQVFMNIITNAIDALDTHNEERSYQEIQKNPSMIKICTAVIGEGTKDNNQRILIKIADNGPGMNPEAKKRLFDPLFTTKPVGKGTGLGLSISYQIVVEKHGGMLTCETELGQGTEFLIEIPLNQQIMIK